MWEWHPSQGVAAGGVIFTERRRHTGSGGAGGRYHAVKLWTSPHIRFRLAAGTGAEVGPDARFMDAVLYCLRTAAALVKPVVINLSFGNDSKPGDGLDDQARWIDGVMDPAQPAGPNNFPRGAVIVRSSGNEGDVSRRKGARHQRSGQGEITVTSKLTDTRGSVRTRKLTDTDALTPPIITSPVIAGRSVHRRQVA